MIFTDLPTGAAVFVDANTFVYHFTRDPIVGPACTAFLDRIEHGDLSGHTSIPVLGEVAHRLMTLEAITLLPRPAAGIGNWLRTHPAEVARLNLFRRAVEEVLRGKLQLLPIAPSVLGAAVVLSQQLGLLTNDALLVALMQANGLSNLASHDTDFDRVPGITRYAHRLMAAHPGGEGGAGGRGPPPCRRRGCNGTGESPVARRARPRDGGRLLVR